MKHAVSVLSGRYLDVPTRKVFGRGSTVPPSTTLTTRVCEGLYEGFYCGFVRGSRVVLGKRVPVPLSLGTESRGKGVTCYKCRTTRVWKRLCQCFFPPSLS